MSEAIVKTVQDLMNYLKTCNPSDRIVIAQELSVSNEKLMYGWREPSIMRKKIWVGGDGEAQAIALGFVETR